MNLGIKKAFILAGGLGTRLRPLTYEMAKLLVPVQGKPVLQWNIELCARYGIEEIVLAVGYKHEQIENFFGSGEKLGVRLHYNVEDKFLGTAGALKFAESYFEKEKKFIMMNGDECKEIDFAALNAVFEKHNAAAAIALTEIDYSHAGGLVRLEGDRISAWHEHPPEEKTEGKKLINAGAYVLSKEIFKRIPSGQMQSIEKDTFLELIKEKRLFGCNCVKQFFQTDTFERYEKAIFGWKGVK